MRTSLSRRPQRPHSLLSTGACRRALVGACAAAVLAGCAVGPDYQRPEPVLPPAWRAPMAEAADVTNTAWWEAFDDADLNGVIRAALDANKDLALATLRIEEFEARLRVSRAANYPKVTAGVSANRQLYSEERPVLLPGSADPFQNAFLVNANISWEIDIWGRVKRANESARAQLLATEEARRTVMLTLVSNVATSYVQLLGLDQQLALARNTLKNREDALQLATTRFEGGSGTRLAVAQARAAVDALGTAVPDIERQQALLENALSVLMGRNPAPVARRKLETLKLPAVPQGVPSDVLTRRPDVLAAEQNLISANALIGVAKAEYFPAISLTGMAGLASDDLRWLTARTARTGGIGASLLGTIFDGGRIAGEVRQSEAVQKQMLVSYEKAVQDALREVEDALITQAKAAELAAAVDRQVKSLTEVMELARMRYEGGQSSFLEVLDAEREFYTAQSQQAQRRGDTYVALIALYKAMGGGWMVEQDRLRAPAAAAAPTAAHQPGTTMAAVQMSESQERAATEQETRK